MPINTAVLALVLIFIPGILCFGVVSSLASKRLRDNVTIFLQVFMYGVASYMLLALAAKMAPATADSLGLRLRDMALLHPASIEKSGIDPLPIAAASVAGCVLGLLITLNINYNLLMRAYQAARITHRFGDPDVWSFILNSNDTDQWVTIRHKERGHIYQGYVHQFSAGDRDREPILSEVRVFALETAEMLGETAFLYLAFKKDDVVLELGANRLPGTTSESAGG